MGGWVGLGFQTRNEAADQPFETYAKQLLVHPGEQTSGGIGK